MVRWIGRPARRAGPPIAGPARGHHVPRIIPDHRPVLRVVRLRGLTEAAPELVRPPAARAPHVHGPLTGVPELAPPAGPVEDEQPGPLLTLVAPRAPSVAHRYGTTT